MCHQKHILLIAPEHPGRWYIHFVGDGVNSAHIGSINGVHSLTRHKAKLLAGVYLSDMIV